VKGSLIKKRWKKLLKKRGQFSFLTQYKDHKNTNNRKKIKVFKEAERVVIENITSIYTKIHKSFNTERLGNY